MKLQEFKANVKFSTPSGDFICLEINKNNIRAYPVKGKRIRIFNQDELDLCYQDTHEIQGHKQLVGCNQGCTRLNKRETV